MRISYFPGCTLKTTAKNFETSAIAVAEGSKKTVLKGLLHYVQCVTIH